MWQRIAVFNAPAYPVAVEIPFIVTPGLYADPLCAGGCSTFYATSIADAIMIRRKPAPPPICDSSKAIILDDASPGFTPGGFTAIATGLRGRSFFADSYSLLKQFKTKAAWTFTNMPSRTYNAFVTWPPQVSQTTMNSTVTQFGAAEYEPNGTFSRQLGSWYVDQKRAPEQPLGGTSWQFAGTFRNNRQTVMLSAYQGFRTHGRSVADAVMLCPAD